MQIDTNLLSLSTAIDQTSAIDRHKTSGATESRPGSNDAIELSNPAQRVISDPNWVDHLRAAYQSGSYKISSEQVANRIINDALQPA